MNPSFERLMAEASRLTQTGDLRAATAAIQAALGGAAVPAPAAPQKNESCVIDVEAREIKTNVDAPPRPPPPPRTEAPAGQFTAGSHTDSAGTREYKLFVPPGYTGQALPLVVMLHGCTQNPDDFAAGTGMNEAARERGVFVLYPAQAQTHNASRCWNWFKHNHQRRGRGEPAILAGMTRAVMKRYDIDPERVYVAGLSAGGAMAAILGDAYPELFAAVGVHSGLPTGSATDVKSAFAAMQGAAAVAVAATRPRPPTIVFHGDRDTTVVPLNGERVVAGNADAAAPEVERARSANGHDYTRSVYRDEAGRVRAEHWLVHGAGHAWSGGSARGSYTDANGPDATEAMLAFFLVNALRGAPATGAS